ncbi:transmembrane protein 230-like [Lytechinus variegatus]|uniref:transmembrane protein 230-like n=1 Tax=Lytechinus variegatus TaxID=7654 RepID=UPI001BB24938|nr:transmembrane protein 230-like [Lytechinus variegatus]XP_041476958.1 transmembrane protein 230-like [Lytechinus variegatus]
MPTYHRMANGAESTDIKYQRMKSPTGDGYTALQFKKRPVKIPWRSITVAIVLFIFGSALLCVGALLLSGHISSKYNDRLWPIMILGVLLFVPGAYHVRLACYAYKGYKGYSFEDIPDYED